MFFNSVVTPPYGIPVSLPPDKIRAEIRSGVVARLQRVCEHWTDTDFDRLVDDVTTTEMKYLRAPVE